MENKSEWCAIELQSGKALYVRFTEDLKRFLEGKSGGIVVTLTDVYVAVRGPNGTTVVLKNISLIQKYRNQVHQFLSSISSITPLEGSGEWAKGLDAVESGKEEMAVVHRPELPKPGAGIIQVGPSAIAPIDG